MTTAGPLSLVDHLSRLMQAHGVAYQIEREWVVPNGALPAIRASWFPRTESGVLEVEVLLENKSIVNECFAGIGAGEAAISDAFQNFTTNSFHVLLAAFWNRVDPQQVTTEEWVVSGKSFRAYIGNFGTRGSVGIKPSVPSELFPAIQSAIEREPLSQDWHWVRHFFCDVKGERTYEALLDNQPWEAGIESMRSIAWVKSTGYYSVRNFLVLRPAA